MNRNRGRLKLRGTVGIGRNALFFTQGPRVAYPHSHTDANVYRRLDLGHFFKPLICFLPLYLCIANSQGYIVVGYRGTFAFGRDMSDVKFRKLNRILVHGKVGLCKEVFKVIKWKTYLSWCLVF
jgi:hypothetical protein